MTETQRWLEARRAELVRRNVGAAVTLTLGLVLLALGAGVALGTVGAYRAAPPVVLLGWLGALGALAWGVLHYRRRHGRIAASALARAVEVRGGLREGSVRGLAEWSPAVRSRSLIGLADTRTAGWLERNGSDALAGVRASSRTELRAGGVTLVTGLIVFTLAGVTGRASTFWHPWAVVGRGRGPVVLTVDRTEVPRGDSVRVTVTASGRARAHLWVRSPGEPWTSHPLVLDSMGATETVLGPLDSDRFLRASSGGRESDTVHVRVQLPALLSELQLSARFPRYLGRPDEPLTVGSDAILLPIGTRIMTSGRATVPLRSVSWSSGERVVSLDVAAERFSGSLRVTRSARWLLNVVRTNGGALDDASRELDIVAVPDSAPVVAIPVPGADTTAPLTLRQPLVIDVRDDHGLASVELLSWRVSRFGTAGDSAIETLPLAAGETDRAVLQWMLDLNGRGFLPGDTAYFKARAVDDAPVAHVGESRTYALRLPSMTELRAATREGVRDLGERADSLHEVQRQLARDLDELSAERERQQSAGTRPGANASPADLPFNSVERTRELSNRQEQAIERAQELKRELEQLADDAFSAGITDPVFQQHLRELQELLDRALSDELRDRIRALQDAVDQLDADAVREALRELAEAADELRADLERGRELFERAAIEGEMSALAQDAEELAARQREWNQQAERDLDSTVANAERRLSAQADSLAAELRKLGKDLERSGESGERTEQAGDQAAQAGVHMQQASSQAERGNQQEARRAGQRASESLDPLADQLRAQRDQLRQRWRQEVLDQMDRALVDVASLARQQQSVMERLDRGESGADVRGAAAAARSGVDQVIEQLQSAAGKNAQVSRQLGTALGYTKLRMAQALEQLQRANPNPRQAAELAGEALDGLNAVAHQLLRSRADVAGAQSGSGLAEALEQLAQMAEQQGALNSEANGMLPMMSMGAQQLMQQLQQLAQRQRALSQELRRLQAEGQIGGAEELADEAEDVARSLEAGRLDRQTIERQERLFRRLLDAGRSLRMDEEDDREERLSQTADPTIMRVSPGPAAPRAGVRYRYPDWTELRSLTPAERRLVLDYFRRLNERPR